MPFCAKYVKYTACVPLTKQTPGGDWDNHTLPAKDAWIQEQTSLVAMERIRHEMNETLQDLEVNERARKAACIRDFGTRTKKILEEKCSGRRGAARRSQTAKVSSRLI